MAGPARTQGSRPSQTQRGGTEGANAAGLTGSRGEWAATVRTAQGGRPLGAAGLAWQSRSRRRAGFGSRTALPASQALGPEWPSGSGVPWALHHPHSHCRARPHFISLSPAWHCAGTAKSSQSTDRETWKPPSRRAQLLATRLFSLVPLSRASSLVSSVSSPSLAFPLPSRIPQHRGRRAVIAPRQTRWDRLLVVGSKRSALDRRGP